MAIDSQNLKLFTDGAELRAAIRAAQQARQTVGLVPTMGALHAGHLSLVEAAAKECDLVVTTIFVNPTQFAPGEDFERYPRDLARDQELVATAGCRWVFAPSTQEMYPEGYATSIDVGPVAKIFEGEIRPNHFAGVATVVLKLFQLAPADRAYFGQKDYQQTIVVKQMVRDLNVPITINVCPIVREPDGLAMSSRNAYLSANERQQATSLYASLQLAKRLAAEGETSAARIRAQMLDFLAKPKLKPQYIAFLTAGTMQPVDQLAGPTVVALAVPMGKTRLIDNLLIE